jgi:protease secretion system outer membrane protein
VYKLRHNFFSQIARLAALFCGSTVVSLATAQSLPAPSITIESFIRQTLVRDPEYQAAKAARDATVENKNINRAGLLPVISLSAIEYPHAETQNRSNISGRTTPWTASSYESSNRSITIRQPILRLRNWTSYLQGNAQAEQAEVRLQFAKYQGILRATELFRDYAVTNSELQTLRREHDYLIARSLQLNEMLQKGMASVTEALEAAAQESNTKRQLAEKERDLAVLKSRFELITGPNTQPSMPAFSVTPDAAFDESAEFRKQMLSNNPELKAVRDAIKIAELEVKKINADHFPTVDLIANQIFENNASSLLIGREARTTNLGFQVTVPIFQGGQITSATRQASANFRRAQHDAQVTEERLQSELVKILGDYQAAIKHTEYAQQLNRFAVVNAKSIRQQRDLGFKTIADLLQAEFLVQKSVSESIGAQYALLIAEISLSALRGDLERVHEHKNLGSVFKSEF